MKGSSAVWGWLLVLGAAACSLSNLDDLKGTPDGTGGAAGKATGGAAGKATGGASGTATGGAAGTAAGGAAGAATGGAGGSGGSGGGGEQCNNGVDDDQNQLTDCADPACAGVTQCVLPTPQNWSGPVWLALASSNDALPSCPGGGPAAIDGGAGALDAPQLTCTACLCANPSGGSCTMGSTGTVYAGGSCGSSSASFSIQPAKCVDFPFVNGGAPKSFVYPGVSVSGSSCTSSGGAESARPEPSYALRARVCAVTAGGGCVGGTSCVQTPASGFETAVCVYRSGDFACPSGYGKKTTIYDAKTFVDTRTCGGCSCAAPVGRTCDGWYRPYYDKGCVNPWGGGTPPKVEANPGCFPGTTAYQSLVVNPGSPTGGSCPPATLPQTGSVAPVGPTTVCCL
ncbi:MAG: hypothetical protein AMXMBFR56_74020 [Polyangiaceae bacterium]